MNPTPKTLVRWLGWIRTISSPATVVSNSPGWPGTLKRTAVTVTDGSGSVTFKIGLFEGERLARIVTWRPPASMRNPTVLHWLGFWRHASVTGAADEPLQWRGAAAQAGDPAP